MAVKSYSNGHKIYYDNEKKIWKYEDNNVDIEKEVRPCPKCKKFPTQEGHDSCIGYIPGLKSACCGHGVAKPYGVTIDGNHVDLNKYLIFNKEE